MAPILGPFSLDRMVRATPEDAYEPSFMEQMRAVGVFGAMPL